MTSTLSKDLHSIRHSCSKTVILTASTNCRRWKDMKSPRQRKAHLEQRLSLKMLHRHTLSAVFLESAHLLHSRDLTLLLNAQRFTVLPDLPAAESRARLKLFSA